MNFAASIKMARHDLASSAIIRYQYEREPERVRSELAGPSIVNFKTDIAFTRGLLLSKDPQLRIASFLFLCDYWKPMDLVDVCVDIAFHDEDIVARGFAIERLCGDTNFRESECVRSAISTVIDCNIDDEQVEQENIDTWINAVSAFVSAEYSRQIANEFKRRKNHSRVVD